MRRWKNTKVSLVRVFKGNDSHLREQVAYAIVGILLPGGLIIDTKTHLLAKSANKM